jgi:hypothetical protein
VKLDEKIPMVLHQASPSQGQISINQREEEETLVPVVKLADGAEQVFLPLTGGDPGG